VPGAAHCTPALFRNLPFCESAVSPIALPGQGFASLLLTWISHRDMVQLVRRCIDHPNYHFATVYGVSNNLRSRWDNTNVKFLGYRPEDDSEIFAAEILARGVKENEIAAQFHGAHYCPMEFTGDTSQVN
jgi:uronate dehydrogenase